MAVAAANTPATSNAEGNPRLRRFQFSLRTALLLMLLASILFAGFAWRRNRAERQRKIVAELRELGANVDHEIVSLFEPPDGNNLVPDDEFFVAALIRRTLGDDFVSGVRRVMYVPSVYIDPRPVPPEERRRVVALVKQLPRLKFLALYADVSSQDLAEFPFLETVEFLMISPRRGTWTDVDLVLFEKCRQLESLSLADQPINGEGLHHLRNCKNLRTLLLCRTHVDDTALVHLTAMTKLETLILSETRVTDTGIAKAQLPQSLQSITLSHTAVGDAALESFQQLPNLMGVYIDKTQVTKQGVQRLKDKRPGCYVID